MRLCLALAVLFLALGTTSGSHFRGGTISWIHDNGNQVKFSYMLAWRRSSMTPCTDDDIAVGVYFSTGNLWQCTQGCSESRTMNIACIEQNSNSDWMVGKGSFNFTVPATQQSIISFASCCWVPVTIATSQGTYDPGSSSLWSMIAVLNPGTRSDTGSPNISPMTTSKPLIKLKVGCTTVWSIPVLDTDRDVVKCRYANKNSLDECGSICGVAPFGTLNGVRPVASITPFPTGTIRAVPAWVLSRYR
uniref:Uncharacterized protein LOC116955363 n=1 Tax=Petromyzon marinus TaxID=7757 RepID=A0AAJ7UCJ1_PETMA|nr:uncharacterized protein LOC116955363 [Petromyzon marinus]